MATKKKPIPLVSEILEKCEQTLSGMPLWKTKGIELTPENVCDNIFILSSDLAAYLKIRHADWCRMHLHKLLKNKYLSEHIRTGTQMFVKGQSAKGLQNVYLLQFSEIELSLMELSEEIFFHKKMELFLELKKLPNLFFQDTTEKEVAEEEKEDMTGIPLLEDVLEPYATTKEGIQLWRKKGITLTLKNIKDSVFILSDEFADYFSMRHTNLKNQIIKKLQKEGRLPDQMLNVKHLVTVGSLAKREKLLYGLTRHETYRIIIDLFGPKAREKKYGILERLEELENEICEKSKEISPELLEKATNWDGVSLLKEFGFQATLPEEEIATIKDICKFLKVPESTLKSFLRRTSLNIQPVKIHSPKTKAKLGYRITDIVKISFWLDSSVGLQIRQRILNKVNLLSNANIEVFPMPKKEIEWLHAFEKVFEGFSLYHNFSIGHYKADFLIKELGLILECDEDDHRTYDQKKEKKKEDYLTKQGYIVIRYNSKTDIKTLFNRILRSKPGQVVKLYSNTEEKKVVK